MIGIRILQYFLKLQIFTFDLPVILRDEYDTTFSFIFFHSESRGKLLKLLL